MLIDEIKKQSETNKVYMFFDMDGVMAEYGAGEKPFILNNTEGFYYSKRPIKTILRVIEDLSKYENIKISILSNCYYREQKEDKIKWLRQYAPFIREENINIIVLKEETYTKETKDYIKATYIKKLVPDESATIYLIEDNHGIINATRKMLKNVNANHVSMLIE